MTMWVWRLSDRNTAYPGAEPWQCREFQITELFEHQRLTQGWGIPGLELYRTEAEWIQNRLAWDNTINEQRAHREYIILHRITNIEIGDTIFLPKVGQNQRSEHHFTVVTVINPYWFNNRGVYPRPWNEYTWDQNFGHIIDIDEELTETFEYSEENLEANVFGAPFLQAVSRIPIDANYRRFGQFLQR